MHTYANAYWTLTVKLQTHMTIQITLKHSTKTELAIQPKRSLKIIQDTNCKKMLTCSVARSTPCQGVESSPEKSQTQGAEKGSTIFSNFNSNCKVT